MKTSMIWIVGLLLAGTTACTKVDHKGSCGDAFLDPGEECEGLELRFGSCQDMGYYRQTGNLVCLADCTIDRTPCEEFCGDGVLQELHETCDGTSLGGLTCDGLGLGNGSLACSSRCELDTSACDVQPQCGDGNVTAPVEQCEGEDLQGQTCQTQGYAGGDLACAADCRFDFTACETVVASCGNGIIDNGETCDGANLGGVTCENQGYAGGVAACSGNCFVDLSGCEPFPETCGNGVWDNGEACDGGDLHGASCVGLGFAGGQLACSGDCQFDTSPCMNSLCGNGIREDGEVCDGSDLNGETCSSRGYYDGQLACAWDCMSFDESNCVNP